MQGGNKNSGRRSVIDMRADKATIEKEIVLGTRPLAEIAKRIGISYDSVKRNKDKITEERRRAIVAEARISAVEQDTGIINQDRMDIAVTYESLAKRVEKLISKAEASGDDSFALAAMEGLRRVLRDIATMQGKLATALTVNVTLSQSREWVQLRHILQEVIDEVPDAREPLLRRMRHHVLSVTKEADLGL
jgi:DNA gyrase/topoisomerase IV subunit A